MKKGIWSIKGSIICRGKLINLGVLLMKDQMHKRTEREIRDCWGDATALLAKLDNRPTSTDVAAMLLLPSPTQLAYDQQ